MTRPTHHTSTTQYCDVKEQCETSLLETFKIMLLHLPSELEYYHNPLFCA